MLSPKKRGATYVYESVPECGAEKMGGPSLLGKYYVVTDNPTEPEGGSSQNGPNGAERVEFPREKRAENTIDGIEADMRA